MLENKTELQSQYEDDFEQDNGAATSHQRNQALSHHIESQPAKNQPADSSNEHRFSHSSLQSSKHMPQKTRPQNQRSVPKLPSAKKYGVVKWVRLTAPKPEDQFVKQYLHLTNEPAYDSMSCQQISEDSF